MEWMRAPAKAFLFCPRSRSGGFYIRERKGERGMGTEVSTIQELLPLVEKCGLSVVLLFLFIIFAYIQWRAVSKGELVPRAMLDRALEDNDRLQDILDKERAAFTQPTLEVLQRLKADHSANSGNDEDRVGQPCGVLFKRLLP